jgi:hypothetical protein
MKGYTRLIVTPFLNDEGLDHVWPDGEGACVLLSGHENVVLRLLVGSYRA